MAGRLLAIGECMVELMQAEGGLMRKSFAGDTFNTAYYARQYLPSDWSVDYFSAVGTDTISDEMLAFMEGHGVGTAHVARIAGRSPGLYMIHLKDGERSFSYWRSASAAKLLARDGDRLRAAIEASDIIVFSGITLAILPAEDVETLLAELRRARAAGKRVVFDPNIRPRLWDDMDRMRATVTEGARAATLVMPSLDDETTHFGDTSLEATIARYGSEGATLVFGEKRSHVPSANVEKIVDTTSAGDSFNGAFLARLATGAAPQEAACFAADVAAAVIQHHGALVVKDKLPQG
jgi:2-dehydro-3-deoxygluconokinase